MPAPENNQPRIIYKAAIALFKDNKILMARDTDNKLAFYTPGGKIEENETAIECAVREVKEELGVDLNPDTAKLLGTFEAPAHNRDNTLVNISLYTGKIKGVPKPTSEIVELRYFDSSVDSKHLTPVLTEKIFPWLKEHGYIN